MNNLPSLCLAALHSAGCTQSDFRKIFLYPETNIERVYNEILNKSKVYTNIISSNRYEKICEKLAKINISTLEKLFEENKIRIISFFEKEYPESLRHAYQYPFLIYAKGNIQTEQITLWVVWSRKYTPYGKSVLTKIFDEIPFKNISIISGGAYGIDSLAHQLAIEKWFHTIAIFGCGINVNYPASNRQLFEKILENNGGLISSFPIDTKPEAYNFPIRNEIVAGLSDSILIPEAGIKSGTLITARLALDLWKDIFTIPGDIFRETSKWCNQLIADGEAKCTTSAQDIFTDYQSLITEQLHFPEVSEKKFESEEAEKIYFSIQNGNQTLDTIFTDTSISIDKIMIEISLLEINWYIASTPHGTYECIS